MTDVDRFNAIPDPDTYQRPAESDAEAMRPHMRPHVPSHPIRIVKMTKTACGSDATGYAKRHAIRERDLEASSTSGVTSEGSGRLVPLERSAAAPRGSRADASFSSPLSTEPATDGNYSVIERIAHEVFDELRSSEPSPEVVERVKALCGQRRIDYGAHPDVVTSVVQAAVESAAVQRTLKPVSSRRGGAVGLTNLGEMARDLHSQLARMRARAKQS